MLVLFEFFLNENDNKMFESCFFLISETFKITDFLIMIDLYFSSTWEFTVKTNFKN